MRRSSKARTEVHYAREIAIAARQEVAFDAIATLRGVRGWWTPLVTGSDEPGGRMRLDFEGLDEHIELQVVVARRPSEIVWAVVEHSALDEWNGTNIRFQLSPHGPAACHLAFEHLGLSPKLACYDDCEAGWDHFLDSIVGLAEHGKGDPFGSKRRRP